MAVVRGLDGRFFEIDDETLNKHEIKKEDLPPAPPPDAGMPAPSPRASCVEIIIRVPTGVPVHLGPHGHLTESAVTWFNGYPNWINVWNNT